MKKKLIVLLLTTCMVSSTLTGCGKDKNPDPTSAENEVDTSWLDDDDEVVTTTTSIQSDISLASNIGEFKAGYETLDYSYTDPQYGLTDTHVFEFDAEDAAGYKAYDAFKVYVSEESLQKDIDCYKANGYHNDGYFSECKYENGKIKVKPRGLIEVDENGSHNSSDGTWGVYNRLILAQWLDLTTGEELSEPIVTIFSINHDIDAPVVNQKLDEENRYTLSWSPVPGASEYMVYCMGSDINYYYQCTTSNTSVNITEFADEKESLELLKEFKMQDTNTDFGMNYEIAHCFKNNSNYVVVAKNGSKQSGLSNIVKPADIAGSVPNAKPSGTPVFKINNALDAPIYGDVEMADGSTKQMLLDYHNGRMYAQEDGSIFISVKFYNTNLAYTCKLTGMEYDEFKTHAQEITARQDKLAQTSGGSIEPDTNVSQVPTSNEEEKKKEAEEKLEEIDIDPSIAPTSPTTTTPSEPTTEVNNSDPDDQNPVVEPTTPSTDDPEVTTTPEISDPDEPVPPTQEVTEPTEPTEPITENPSTPNISTNELYNATLVKINEVYNTYGINVDDLTQVLYANSQLEAYLAYAIAARLEVITVPTDIYPEAANIDYLATLFIETYRQNPTSGVMKDLQYSYDYNALLVYYADDTDTRLKQTAEELSKAKSVANSVVDSSMSDMEKVYAFNKYFCDRASYDFDSMSTNVDMNSLSQKFIDAHTPYGILCKDYGVCESYSEAFALAGRFAGLNVIMETGTLNGGGHEWNKVCLDGQYYIVDITNNDMEIGANSLLLVAESQAPVLAADHTAYMFSAPATDTSKEYYANTVGLFSSKDAAVEEIKKQLDSNKVANVRFSYDITEDEATDILLDVYNAGYPLNKYNIFNGVVGVNLQ